MKSFRRHPRRVAAVSAAILAAAGLVSLLAWMGVLGSNFREVSPGRFYRSGEMSAEAMGELIDRLGIKCVVNLQSAPGDWARYEAQIEACRRRGVVHDRIPLSPTKLPGAAAAKNLVERLESGPFPMLVHCSSGADRAGLAAAAYLIQVEKRPLEEAVGSQLTWRFGHVPIGGSIAMDRFFDRFREASEGRDFKSWVLLTYPAIAPE